MMYVPFLFHMINLNKPYILHKIAKSVVKVKPGKNIKTETEREREGEFGCGCGVGQRKKAIKYKPYLWN